MEITIKDLSKVEMKERTVFQSYYFLNDKIPGTDLAGRRAENVPLEKPSSPKGKNILIMIFESPKK